MLISRRSPPSLSNRGKKAMKKQRQNKSVKCEQRKASHLLPWCLQMRFVLRKIVPLGLYRYVFDLKLFDAMLMNPR